MSSATLFRADVLKHWKKNGRHKLPWRKTKDPYKILVAEIMLQQTQVSRVLEKYKEFLKVFPTAHTCKSATFRRAASVERDGIQQTRKVFARFQEWAITQRAQCACSRSMNRTS